MLLFRAMKASDDGLPVVEASARGLGVRPGVDLPVVDGFVAPETGGMSVTPADVTKLPHHRLPRAFGGEGRDPAFRIAAAALPRALAVRAEAQDHALVEPCSRVPLDVYLSTLGSTREAWSRVA